VVRRAVEGSPLAWLAHTEVQIAVVHPPFWKAASPLMSVRFEWGSGGVGGSRPISSGRGAGAIAFRAVARSTGGWPGLVSWGEGRQRRFRPWGISPRSILSKLAASAEVLVRTR